VPPRKRGNAHAAKALTRSLESAEQPPLKMKTPLLKKKSGANSNKPNGRQGDRHSSLY
jgi:hypothetical protein